MKKMYNEENIYTANPYRKEYLSGVCSYIDRLMEQGNIKRNADMTPESFKNNIEFYREKYLSMLGEPLVSYEYRTPEVRKSYVGEDDYGEIYRLQINIIDDLNFYGILCMPNQKKEKYPLLIAQHGGGGSPELLCDMHGAGNYSHISKLALEQGFAVFAPQLLLWNFNVGDRISYGEDMDYNRGAIDQKLKQRGSSITALEVFCIMRSIDYFTSLDEIDSSKIGMIGLSYGGYFTMYTAAADTRIKAAYSCASFNDRNVICFPDWRYQNSSNLFYDAEVAGLCAPRPLFVDVGKADEVFDWRSSVSEAERAKSFYDVYGGECRFRYNLWEGGHRIDVDGPYLADFFKAIKD